MLGFKRERLGAVVLAWSGILVSCVLGDEKPASHDRWGDPLPSGAMTRLGSVRLRMGGAGMALTCSHDGKLLAAVDLEGELHVWSAASGKELAHCPRQSRGPGLIFSADDKRLASVGEGATILLFDLSVLSKKGESSILLKEPNPAIHYRGNPAVVLAFLPDGKTLLSGDIDGQAHLWDIGRGNEVRKFGTTARAQHRYALSPDGKTLAVAPDGEAPTLWDVTTGKRIGRMPGREGVLALAFSPDNKRLAAGTANSDTIRLFDVATRKEFRSLRDDKTPSLSQGVGSLAHHLAFLPDGKTLVSLGGHLRNKIRIWDVESGELRRSIPVRHGEDRVLALSPDGRMVATSGWNNVVRTWELSTGKELHDDLHQGSIKAVAVSPTGQQVAVGSYDGFVRLYECATGVEVRGFLAGPSPIDHLTYTSDGKAIFVAVAYHGAKLWNVTNGKEIRSFPGAVKGQRGLWRAAFSRNGTPLTLAVWNSSLQIVNAGNGKVLQRLSEKQWASALAFSPDGAKLVGGAFDGNVHLWEVASGKELWIARNKTGDIASVTFAPDGDLVAIGDYGACIYLLSGASGKVVRSLVGVRAQALAFSPDGRLLAVGGAPRDVLLMETASGTVVRRLSGHKGPVAALSFNPDGRSLVSGSEDATALIWDITGRAFVNQPTVLSDADLANLWTDLGAADGATGYAAVWALLQSGKQGLAFLQARLRSVPDDQTIAQLIAQLDDDAFAVRQKASAALARMGRGVQTPLKETLAKKPSVEVQRRIRAILEKIGDKGDARLRGLRLAAVLEHADVSEARTPLQRLADKDPSEEVRHAARGALKRLENAASRP
ncbi:MAG TPA: WD40 repeat domain-containing protein [Gemmataceae bacterium]|jgi:WD40 repeat protein